MQTPLRGLVIPAERPEVGPRDANHGERELALLRTCLS